ncbi:BT_3987 domain-containing protein [Pedobacter nyackensis]|uniref:BT_3987 domain-containing protein n=1 Tax=Pedobacter nyackensis TaxID=475255 RepID=UPI00293044FA|nr:DUF1735 domain-containing protein [Pedobacter nyackensis]
MKSYYILIAYLALFTCGCKPQLGIENSDTYTQIYMPQAVNNPIESTFFFSDDIDTLIYGANFGGPANNDYDIGVQFKVDPALVAPYNTKTGSDFQLLPADVYEMETPSSVILKGSVTTGPLVIKIKTNKIPGVRKYLLPVTLSSGNNPYKINNDLKTAYFVVSATYETNPFTIMDKTAWSLVDVSDEETVGEGPNNGRAIFAIDASSDTYWHTVYRPVALPPPHWLEVDTKTAHLFHGFKIKGRSDADSGNPSNITVELSDDGQTWVNAGEFTLANKLENSIYLPEFKTARYFKLTITATHGNKAFSYLSDIAAF